MRFQDALGIHTFLLIPAPSFLASRIAKMDLSHLTRTAVLCQCLRCSSSLAVLENEWGKLSNVYAVATAWLSVDLHRISISSEQKHIPQTSEMSLLRGRIAQDVACKLCQQKLAVLCGLDNGYVT